MLIVTCYRYVWLLLVCSVFVFFFSSRRRHTRCLSDWSSDVCSSDLTGSDRPGGPPVRPPRAGRGAPAVGGPPGRSDPVGRPLVEVDREAVRGDVRRSEERRVGKGWRWRVCGGRAKKREEDRRGGRCI